MNRLCVNFELSEEESKEVLSALRPELDSDEYGRSKVTLRCEKGLILDIESPDLHALRAAANTYLRWIDMCVKLSDKS